MNRRIRRNRRYRGLLGFQRYLDIIYVHTLPQILFNAKTIYTVHTMKTISNANLRASIRSTTRKYGAKKVRLFGSYVRNEQRRNSDLDLLVEMPKGSTILDLVGLKNDLEKKLGSKVDVITYNSIKPALRERILTEAKTL